MNRRQFRGAARVVLAAVLALALSGCFRARILNGVPTQPRGPSPVVVSWYLTVAWVIDISGPVDITRVCPSGAWTELRVAYGPLAALVNFLTATIVTPQTTTVICADGYAVEGVVEGDKMTRVDRVYEHRADE